MENLEILENAAQLTYGDIMNAVREMGDDQRMQLAILADRISEILSETRTERGGI